MGFGVSIYVNNSADAVELYQKIFGLELGYHVKNPDGSFYHSELYKNGECFLSVVEAHKNVSDDSIIQLSYEFNSADEVKHAFALLSEGGKVEMELCELPWSPCAGALTDKFGVSWYLSSNSHLPPDDYDYWDGNPIGKELK